MQLVCVCVRLWPWEPSELCSQRSWSLGSLQPGPPSPTQDHSMDCSSVNTGNALHSEQNYNTGGAAAFLQEIHLKISKNCWTIFNPAPIFLCLHLLTEVCSCSISSITMWSKDFSELKKRDESLLQGLFFSDLATLIPTIFDWVLTFMCFTSNQIQITSDSPL